MVCITKANMSLTELILWTALFLGSATARHNSRQPDGSAPSRIVGGSDVPQGEYVPYQVSMQYQVRDGYAHFCGGSIIAPDRILTAAHCCDGMNVTHMSVVAGVRNLNDKGGTRYRVVSYVIHPDYKALDTSDIAVLTIDPPLVYNNVSVAPIEFSSETFVGGGVPVTLTGWGLRFPAPFPFLDNLNFPNTLQRMNYRTITNQECQQRGMEDVTETEICARGIFRGACSGDSGGPLVRDDNGLKQVGIVSYGLVVCGLFVSPDVYTRVSTFRNWIQERMETKN